MAITPKVLADGQLPSSSGTLFTASATTLVKLLHLHNRAATGETAVITVNTTGTNRTLGRAVLTQDEQADVIDKDEALTLESGDTIDGSTTNALSVDYIITGAEVT